MKAILCLALLALTAFAASPITDETANFFIGNWYSVGFNPSAVRPKDACCPYGKVTITSAGAKTTMSATNWVGYNCYDMDLLIPGKSLSFNLDPASSFLGFSKLLAAKKRVFSSPYAVQFIANDLQLDTIYDNNSTQKVTFELTLSNYMSGGETCSVVLSKASTPVTTAEAAKQAGISSKKVISADDLDDFDAFELFDEIFKDLSEVYSIKSKFLSYDE